MVAHLIFLLLSEQDSVPAPSSSAFEDNVKISTDLASKFCPSHVHALNLPDSLIMICRMILIRVGTE